MLYGILIFVVLIVVFIVMNNKSSAEVARGNVSSDDDASKHLPVGRISEETCWETIESRFDSKPD